MSRTRKKSRQRTGADLRTELRGWMAEVQDDPRQRLALAADLYGDAQADRSDAQSRLDLLQAAVQMDPFSVRYRLALGQAEREAGLVDAAIAGYREALEMWPESPELNLLLGEALLDAGKPGEAVACFDKVPAASGGPGAAAAQRAEYGRIEAAMRQAKTAEDWQKVAARLEAMAGTLSVGIFLEKCLKGVVECEDAALRDRFVALARRAGDGAKPHPALALVERAAQYAAQPAFPAQPPSADGAGRLEPLLHAYLLTRALPLATPGLDKQIEALNAWRASVERVGDAWPELRQGYLHLLDEWASQAYKQQKRPLAALLWGEAERLGPHLPALLQNLALVHTREADEAAYAYYWDAFTRAWTQYGELLPEAEAYRRPLLQKHQAFADGARKKLQSARDPRTLLELGETWTREAISFLALEQLDFRNPCFRLGAMADDWSSDKECEAALAAGQASLTAWLDLMDEWQPLGEDAALPRWRRQRLAQAAQAAACGGDARYYCYDEELKEFQKHREQVTDHFLPLLFHVLMPAAGDLDLDDAEARRRYAAIGRGLLTFPHPLLRPGLVRFFEQQRETAPSAEARKSISGIIEAIDKDLEGLVENYALGPWLKTAQERMERRQWSAAATLLEEAQRMRPGSAVALFLLAQCRAGQERFDEAFRLAGEARAACRDKDALKAIDQLAAQMDVARVNKRLEVVQKYLKEEKGQAAIKECQAALKDYPAHPYVLFVLAQAYLTEAQVVEARDALARAKRGKPPDELRKAIDELSQQADEHGPEIVLSRAVPLMQAKKWKEARARLANGRALQPPSARISFYEAICAAQSGETAEADKAAQAALKQLKPDEGELREEIESFLPQIALIPIQEQLGKAQSAMQGERWSQAIPHLEEAIRRAPQAALPRFYLAICQFKVELWDQAERTAKSALPFCGKGDAEIKSQLKTMLEQIPKARHGAALAAINKALERQDWRGGLKLADAFLNQEDPSHPVALFFKAVCEFQLGDKKAAKSTAERALPLAKGSEYANIRSQLQQIVKAADVPPWVEDMNKAVQAMNRQSWDSAIPHLDSVLRRDSSNAQAYYYRALCKHQSKMAEINRSGGLKPWEVSETRDYFEDVSQDLFQALTHADRSEKDLISGIGKLLEAVNKVLEQLRWR